MKKVISAVCLSVISATIFAQDLNDIRPSYTNELHISHIPVTLKEKAYSTKANSITAAGVSDETVAEVVVFYQPSYIKMYGEYEAFQRIQKWFDLTNAAFTTNGQSNFKVKIKDIVPVVSIADDVPWEDVYDEDGNIIRDGAEFLFSGAVLNAGSPEYDTYQTKWKGDLVVYVREQRQGDFSLGFAGIGGEMSSLIDNGSNPERYTTLAHEIGHNIGMNHEAAKAFVGPDYARAWECNGKYTIMYSSSAVNTQLLHYSSPSISNSDETCGVDGEADNARLLAENFDTVSQRRDAVVSMGTVSMSEVNFAGSEEESVMITLIRDGDLSSTTSVKIFAMNGTAEYGKDFVKSYVLAEFEAGQDTINVQYPIVQDSEKEGDENFTVSLRFAYKMDIGTANTATVTLTDATLTGAPGEFSIMGESEVNEGDEVAYTITRTNGTASAIVNVKSVASSAKSGSDYYSINELLEFKEGETEKTVTLTVVDDEETEVSEILSLEINSPSEAAQYDIQAMNVTILDNDNTAEVNAGEFGLSATETTVSEGAGGVTITVVRTNGSSGDVVVRVTTEQGTAIEGTDYIGLNEEVLFKDGETEKEVTVIIRDDSIDEAGNNTFKIMLDGQGATVTSQELTITITDNDDAKAPAPAKESASGGTFNIFALLGLMLVAIRRKA
jgi:hypothetical protein